MTTFNELREELIVSLEEEKEYMLEDNYPGDFLSEAQESIVYSTIPTCTSELAQYAKNHFLECVCLDRGLLPNNPSCKDIVVAHLYERLSEEAYEWLAEQQ